MLRFNGEAAIRTAEPENFKASTHKKNNLQVVKEQETFHNQNVGLLFRVGHISHRGQADTMGTGKLDWVLNPGSNGVGHGLHVQRCDHCGATLENGRQWKATVN